MEAVNGYQEADKSHSERVSRTCLSREEYSFFLKVGLQNIYFFATVQLGG